MEFNSPRPEHVQLNTAVHPKSTSNLLALLHQQIFQATGSHHHSASSDLGSSTHSNRMSVSLPKPAELSIETVLEEHLIPSPPLSPKLSHSAAPVKLPAAPAAPSDTILVKPAWQEQISSKETVRRYHYATNGFLSQYRLFNSLKPKRKQQANKVLRRTRANRNMINTSGSEFEKTYRTRRVTKTIRNVDDDDEFVSLKSTSRSSRPSRPSTPLNRRPRKTPSAFASPLASANAVGFPQYIPNMSWEKLPDYSPPLSTLPDNNKCLKVEWKGSSMDLSEDPLKHKLHPAELVLAQILRLPCDLYLDSKRRLFLEKVHRLKKGMPFRRTDAQKACRIDVNKASRLYAAYERIGWLGDKNFEKYI